MEGLLKFITCGSVDDGKSTLIGHMLYDAKLLFTDQERALELDSKVGSCGGAIDYSLLLDGLMAEREQGITIDVAYRYFSTENRSFIVADTPGHEEYTRNMAVGASFAQLATILVDATQGVLIQTKRHTRICSLMGIKHFIFAVNKMDLVHYDKERFERIKKQIKHLMVDFNFISLLIVPVSATEGDNITNNSARMPWYKGSSLLDYLEHIDVDEDDKIDNGFVMPVQRVSRPDHNYRGYQGLIECGCVVVGDIIEVVPGREKARIKSILVAGKQKERAYKGEAVSVQLDREIDVSRGCVLCQENVGIRTSKMFTVRLLWMDEKELIAGKSYDIKIGTKTLPATVMRIKYKVDVNDGQEIPSEQIYKNELAICDLSLSEKIAYDEFENNKVLGSFILIDRISHMTSACGTIEHELRRAENLTWQETEVTRILRAEQKTQRPVTLWFTGLSGAGKSAIANEVEKRLYAEGKHTMLLDGDNIRLGLNSNLGFKEQDRIENIRRIAEVAKLMNDAGLIVLVSCISPYEADRKNAARIIGQEYIEIYVSTPLSECEKRDVKGLYKKARRGDIPNFTGINSCYDIPSKPHIEIDTSGKSVDDVTEYILKEIRKFL